MPEHISFAASIGELPRVNYENVIWITDRLVNDLGGFDEDRILWHRPKSLVLGVGCERGISADALEDGILRVVREHGYSPTSIGTLASLDLKADEEGLLEVANRHGWDTAFFPAEELAGVQGLANPSAVVQECVGTPGVAEPAALLAAGSDRLLVEKQVVASPLSPKRMTIALARRSDYQERASGLLCWPRHLYRRRAGRPRFAHGQGRSRDPERRCRRLRRLAGSRRGRAAGPRGRPCTTRRT